MHGIEFIDENDPSFLETEAAMVKWEQVTLKRYEVWKQERIKLLVHVFVCSASQIILITLLFRETAETLDLRSVVHSNVSLGLLTAKGICAMILHLAMQSGVKQGNEMMKYALNHQDKFLNWSIAVKLGLFLALTTMAVETISLIVIFTATTVQDVVFNFIALQVIDEF